MSTYHGFILKTQNEKSTVQYEDLVASNEINYSSDTAAKGWKYLEFLSPKDYYKTDDDRLGPFTYPLLCRLSGSRLLLSSLKKEIVSDIQYKYLMPLGTRLTNQPVNVDGLIKHLVINPNEFTISFLHAKVAGYGSSLRSVSLFGDDIANAKLFRDQLDALSFISCGLGDLATGQEIMRLSNNGGISFSIQDRFLEYDGEQSVFQKVENTLGFVRENGFFEL